MGNLLHSLRGRIGRCARDESGTATIPFIIFVPFFLLLVMSSLEMGVLMMRSVMLERALDMSVRDLRLGTWKNPTHAQFKKVVCERAAILPDCLNVLLVELRPVSTVTWQPLASGAVCVDRSDSDADLDALTEFTPGAGDQMMLIRACSKFDPIFPTSGLGFHLPKDDTGAYALISSTAFVNEPDLGG